MLTAQADSCHRCCTESVGNQCVDCRHVENVHATSGMQQQPKTYSRVRLVLVTGEIIVTMTFKSCNPVQQNTLYIANCTQP